MERDIQKAKTALNKARQESEAADSTASQHAKEDAGIYKDKLESVERQSRQHDVLLRWIEQQRTRIQAEQEIETVLEADDQRDEEGQVSNAIRRATVGKRKRKRKSRSVFGPVPSGVKKPKATKRNAPRQKRKVLEVLDVSEARQRGTPRPSESRDRKPRHVKQDKPLRPFRPQNVFKDNPSNTKAKLTRSCKALNRAGALMTRSGRISRPPDRWIPG